MAAADTEVEAAWEGAIAEAAAAMAAAAETAASAAGEAACARPAAAWALRLDAAPADG